MNTRLLGLLTVLAGATPVGASIVSLAPPPVPVAPPAAPDVGFTLPPLPLLPLNVVEPPTVPDVGLPTSPEPPANPIAPPPSGPVAFSVDPEPVAPPLSVNPPDPVPGPLGVVGVLVAAGLFGIRKLVRRKPTDEPTAG